MQPATRLSVFLSRDLMFDHLVRRHGMEPTDRHCRRITAYVSQGAQFFDAARTAAPLARPLLLYYGVLALTRAVILVARRPSDGRSLKHGHGLGARGWEQWIRKKAILDVPLHVVAGTFTELAEATCNAEMTYARWRSDLPSINDPRGPRGLYVWTRAGADSFPDKYRCTLGDVIARLPDIAFLFEETLNTRAECFPAQVTVARGPFNMGSNIPARDKRIRVELRRNDIAVGTAPEIVRRLELNAQLFSETHPTVGWELALAAEIEGRNDIAKVLPPLAMNRHWVSYAVVPFPGSVVLSTLSAFFLASYALGMLVRYFPEAWQDLSSGRSGDRVFPVLNATVDLIEERFPREVVDAFDGGHKTGLVLPAPVAIG